MKINVLLLTFLLTSVFTTRGQIITQLFSLTVPCCNNSDSIDIGNNGIFDIKVLSMSGFDAVQINDTALMSNIDVSDHPVDSGTAFTYYNVYGGIIAQTSILCSWNSVWYPNSGEKYKGFRRINAPGDTTYGWIKYNFVGNAASCSDTVYGIELAYSSVSNIHLYAGEGIITGVFEVGNGNTLEILPTITTDNIQITNHSTMKQTVSLFNSVGQLKRTIFINSNTTIQLDIANLKKGIYFLRTTETNRPTRIVKL